MQTSNNEVIAEKKLESEPIQSNVAAKDNSSELASKGVQEEGPEIKTEENKANWRAFREQREAERKTREEALHRAREKEAEAEALRAALEALANKPSNNNRINEHGYEETEETEEQKIDRKVEQALRQREVIAEKQRREQEQRDLPNRLANTYSDFNRVCTSENLDYLEYHYPEVAKPLQRLPDDFDKWADIYKAVKKFVPNIDSRNEAKKAEKNLQKPGSISSSGNTLGANAMPGARLDEQRKAANWERMQKTIKGLSS